MRAFFILVHALSMPLVWGAIIEVTAGGEVSDPTYQFTGWQGEHLANWTAINGTITASGDVKTGNGNRVDDMAARLAAAEATIASLTSQLSRVLAPEWAIGLSSSDQINVGAVTTYLDAAGAEDGYLFCGMIRGATSIGSTTISATRREAYVARVSRAGRILWARSSQGSSSETVGHSVASDGAGGAYVMGYVLGSTSFGSITLTGSGYDTWVAHISASTNWDWAALPGITASLGQAMTPDGSGGAFVVTVTSQLFTFGGTSYPALGGLDAVLVHVTGNPKAFDWVVRVGGSLQDQALGVANDGSGGAIMVGIFTGTATFGAITLVSAGSSDIFVLHATSAGQIDWAVRAGGSGADTGMFHRGSHIAPDGLGGAIITGSFVATASFGATTLTSAGGTDIFAAHVTSAGVIDWAVRAGGSDADYGYSAAPDGMGGAIITGEFRGTASFGTSLTSAGGTDIFAAHVTSAGSMDWALRAGGTADDDGNSIAADATGAVIVMGRLRSTPANFESRPDNTPPSSLSAVGSSPNTLLWRFWST
jgi:hypothetical protein